MPGVVPGEPKVYGILVVFKEGLDNASAAFKIFVWIVQWPAAFRPGSGRHALGQSHCPDR